MGWEALPDADTDALRVFPRQREPRGRQATQPNAKGRLATNFKLPGSTGTSIQQSSRMSPMFGTHTQHKSFRNPSEIRCSHVSHFAIADAPVQDSDAVDVPPPHFAFGLTAATEDSSRRAAAYTYLDGYSHAKCDKRECKCKCSPPTPALTGLAGGCLVLLAVSPGPNSTCRSEREKRQMRMCVKTQTGVFQDSWQRQQE